VFFLLREASIKFLKDGFELRHENLTLVVRVSQVFHCLDELLPSFANAVEQLGEDLKGLIRVHLLMQQAEVLVVLGRLPASIVLTRYYLLLGFDVLSEVEAFHREHFRTDGQLEVLVADHSVAVEVELAVDFLEGLVRDGEAPEVKVIFQLLLRDGPRLTNIQVHEGLAQGLPLKLDLLKDLLFHITRHQILLSLLQVRLLGLILAVEEALVLGVLDGVVAEVEAFAHVDRVSQPL